MAEALHVFTSAAVNYLPKVRILCHSIRRYHPEAVIHLALADERPQWLRTEDEPFDSILGIERLGIPDYRNWTFTHSIVELSTAIKPFALKHLLQLPDCATVLYFDPDMVLFSRVDDILATLAHSNLALTPHQTKPEQTLDAIFDNEIASLKHGVFNLGFIGVRNTAEGRRFADWWAERTYHLCWADVENGLFTDQKWINFAPVFFDGVAIVKSSRHNVATWNLTTRRMTGSFAERLRSRRRAAGLLPFHRLRQRRAPDHGDQECIREPGGAGVDLVVRARDRHRRSRSRQRMAMGVRALFRRDADRARPPPALSRSPRSAEGLSGTLRCRIGAIELSRLVQVRGRAALPGVVRQGRRAQETQGAAHPYAAFRCRWRFAFSACSCRQGAGRRCERAPGAC